LDCFQREHFTYHLFLSLCTFEACTTRVRVSCLFALSTFSFCVLDTAGEKHRVELMRYYSIYLHLLTFASLFPFAVMLLFLPMRFFGHAHLLLLPFRLDLRAFRKASSMFQWTVCPAGKAGSRSGPCLHMAYHASTER
jgi:hypothetical protein